MRGRCPEFWNTGRGWPGGPTDGKDEGGVAHWGGPSLEAERAAVRGRLSVTKSKAAHAV